MTFGESLLLSNRNSKHLSSKIKPISKEVMTNVTEIYVEIHDSFPVRSSLIDPSNITKINYFALRKSKPHTNVEYETICINHEQHEYFLLLFS